MMKTCCPQCETVLTLNQQQIEQRNGMVRCGVCRQVFNALEHLYEEEDDYPILNEDIAPEVENLSSVVAHEPTYRAAMVRPSQEEQGKEERTYPRIVHSGVSRPLEEQRNEGRTHPTVHIHVNNAAPVSAVQGKGEPRLVMSAAASRDDDEYYIGDIRETRGIRVDDEEDDFRIQGDRVYEDSYDVVSRRSSGFGMFWFVLILLALLLIVGQVFYVFRNQISSTFPAMRPVLMQICGVLKCEIGIQKSVDNLALENVLISVDKTKLPKRGEHALLLQAVLVNKVNQAQEWPMLILRLKNAEGVVMNSKNIQPKEYLLPEQSLQPFPAQSRHSINLPFMLEGDAISSYEVSIFYP